MVSEVSGSGQRFQVETLEFHEGVYFEKDEACYCHRRKPNRDGELVLEWIRVGDLANSY